MCANTLGFKSMINLCVILLSTSFVGLSLASDVLDYSVPDFDVQIKKHEIALVEFFAPWCPHCQRLAPTYEAAATALKSNDPPVPLAKVDCTSDDAKMTCAKYGVSGYPTLKIFRNGEVASEYEGPRDEEGMVKYMKSQVGPSSKETVTVEEAESALDSKAYVAFGFFKKKGSKLVKEFMKMADKFRGKLNFAHSFNSEIIEKFGSSDRIIMFQPKHMHNKFEESRILYEGSANTKELEKFIKEKQHGLVGHRTPDNQELFENPLVVAYFKIDYVNNIKATNYWRNRIIKVARGYSDRLHFAISDKESYYSEMEEYGLDNDLEEPAIRIQGKDNEKYRMDDTFSVENFEKFVQDFLAGKLKPYRKSEPLPEPNDEPVKVAVADNFEQVVMEPDKDVLLEFYAPWCGHCKALAPTYDKLGKAMKNEEVEIVKMNAVDNDVPAPFVVQGYPTIYWLPKNKKKSPVKYEGDRDLKDFIKYIAKHATNELKRYDRDGKKKTTKETKKEEL